MAEYNFDEYMSTMNSLRDEILSARDSLAKLEYEQGVKNADSKYLSDTRNAYVDYVKRNNPYGYDREKLASLGLGSSGAERKALSDSFSEYQSYLGRALSEKADIHKNLVNELVHSQLENDEKRKQYALEDAKAKMENYWREYEWDYIRNRDKIEDERYEKELRG